MARYNREFLVMYLQDICTLYVVKKQIEEKCDEISVEIEKKQKSMYNLPNKPVKEKCVVYGGAGMFLRITGTILVGLSILVLLFAIPLLFYLHMTGTIVIWCIATGIALFIASVPIKKAVRKKDMEYSERVKERLECINNDYRIQCEQYDRQCLEIAERKRKDIALYENQLKNGEMNVQG